MQNTGMVRVSAATPAVRPADIDFNKTEILKLINEAEEKHCGFILLPELAITGYSIGDLVHQSFLYDAQIDALFEITEATKKLEVCVILGCYIRVKSYVFNCAAVIKEGRILGIAPKTMLPNQAEFTEMRWFDQGSVNFPPEGEISLRGEMIPFGNIVFDDEEGELSFGIEICRDIWTAMSPSSFLSIAGAHLIFTPSASTESAGKAGQRRSVLSALANKNNCGYIYTSCGMGESGTECVFGGHRLIIEEGTILAESDRFVFESDATYTEIDIEKIRFDRMRNRNIKACNEEYLAGFEVMHVAVPSIRMIGFDEKLYRKYAPNPWILAATRAGDEYCADVFNIQVAGLCRRMQHIGAKRTVIGVSGGLDSTTALLVAVEAHKALGLPVSDVIAITLPGFGTSDHTHENAITMMRELGVTMREISIKDAVLQHFKDIGHDPSVHDLTYENSQARERTQILMDIAGKENALMIGTGDLSEIALGWCTFNGDHMAFYGVNGSLPKTLLPYVLTYVMNTRYVENQVLKDTIQSVIDTPISPELLPPDENGKIAQKTEDKVGPYVLHDFFIFHTMISGWAPRKMLYMAEAAFAGIFDRKYIAKWQRTFYQRFFAQQFKRNCAPDCPNATQFSFVQWHMASDLYSTLWLEEMDKLMAE